MGTQRAEDIQRVRADRERLWRSLMDMAEVGAVPGGGSNRVALTDSDAAGHALFAEWARASGLIVARDRIGSLFATRRGTDADRPAVVIGSHLDTQPHGGRFDGPIGVLAGLEIIRTLDDHRVETAASLVIASWANEEGARFPQPMTGSGVFAGVLPMENAIAQRAIDGPTFGEELERLGLAGQETIGGFAIGSYFELHIEQATALERTGTDIGIVERGQGIRALGVTLTGESSHAGTTAMLARRDALVAAARVVELARHTGLAAGALVTVGRLEVRPNSRSVVPGEVSLVIDIRDPEPATIEAVESSIRTGVADVAAAAAVDAEIEVALDIPAVVFDASCKEAVRAACRKLGLSSMPLLSGAAHDAMNIARIAPSALVFIPCRNGVSHNPAEYVSPTQVAAGCDVILHAVLARAGVATS